MCSTGLTPRDIHSLAVFDSDGFLRHQEIISEAAAKKSFDFVSLIIKHIYLFESKNNQ